MDHRIGVIREGETVVDIGSGGGMDLLIAARRVGETGRAVGIDFPRVWEENVTSSVGVHGANVLPRNCRSGGL